MELSEMIATVKPMQSKSEAIKFLKDNNELGWGLKDSKDFYDQYIFKGSVTSRIQDLLQEAKTYFLDRGKLWQSELIQILLNNL